MLLMRYGLVIAQKKICVANNQGIIAIDRHPVDDMLQKIVRETISI